MPFSCGRCRATQESFPPCSAPGSARQQWETSPVPCIPLGLGKARSRGTPHPSELPPTGVRSMAQRRVPHPFRAGWLSFAPGPEKIPGGSILGWGLLLFPTPRSFSSALRAPGCVAGPCARIRAPGSLGSPAGFANSVALVCLKSVARAKSLIASSLAPSSRTSAGPGWRGFAAGELRALAACAQGRERTAGPLGLPGWPQINQRGARRGFGEPCVSVLPMSISVPRDAPPALVFQGKAKRERKGGKKTLPKRLLRANRSPPSPAACVPEREKVKQRPPP